MSAVNVFVAQRQMVSSLPDLSLPSPPSSTSGTKYQTAANIEPSNRSETLSNLLTQLSNSSSNENGSLNKIINAENDAQRSSPSFTPFFPLAIEGPPSPTIESTPPPWQGLNSAFPFRGMLPMLSPLQGPLVRENKNHSILPHHDYSHPTAPSSNRSTLRGPNEDPRFNSNPSSFQPQIPGRTTIRRYLLTPPQEFPRSKPEDQQHRDQGRQKTNDRPFECGQCPQSFNRNHDLKRHKRIHLTVKPFPCSHCNKSFSRKDALKVVPRPVSSEDYYCTDY